MTPDAREKMQILCQRIATEQNREKFTQLVEELNALLERKEARLDQQSHDQQSQDQQKPK